MHYSNNTVKAAIAGAILLIGYPSIAQAKTVHQICADHDNYKKSIAACNKIISGKYNKKRKANALVNKCATLGRNQEHDASIATCKKALEIIPNIKWANNNIGFAYNKKGDREKSALYFKRELESHPNHRNSLNGLCYQLLNLKREYEAIDYCKRSIKVDSKYKWPYYNLGFIYKNLGYYNKSVEYFNDFIKLARAENKNDTDAYTASNEVATLKRKLGDLRAGLEDEKSTDTINHADWKVCLGDQPNVPALEKLDACERIILRPKWVKSESGGWAKTGRLREAFTARAKARTDLKQHDLAELDYEFLLEINPQSPEALLSRAATHEAQGNLRSAVKDVKAALLMLPSTDPRQPKLRQQLENLEYKIKISAKSAKKKKRASQKKKTTTRRAKTKKKAKRKSTRRTSQASGRIKSYEEAYAYCRKRYGRENVINVRKRNGKYTCYLDAFSPNE